MENKKLMPKVFKGLHIRWVWPKQLKILQAMPTSQAAPNITALNAVTALSNPNSLLIHTIGGSKPSASGTLLFLCQCDVVEPLSSQWDHHSLQCPSTQYSFVEAACTTAGCQTGGVANVTTLDSVRDVGTSFDSRGLATFSGHMFLCGFINQATVQFHAYNPSGILFYQINSVITDFLGVKMHGGLPWLIFDVGSGPAVVGSNSTRTFIDGQWHTGHVVLFEQAFNTFYVTVAPDGFDAVSVQNVGSTYIIVSWDLPTHSNGILINFILQSRPQALHSSWNMVLGVISAAASLPRPYGGAYSHSPIPQLEQDVGMGHLFPPPPQTGNPGSITEIGCTLLSGSAEQDALTMKESPLKT
eukprot:Em0001g2786a